MNSRSRVLVTGSSGVIGRQLVAQLLSAGQEVLAIDRDPMPPGDWSGLTFVQDDLSTMDLSPVKEFGPDTVVHLAASFERSDESAEYWAIGWRDDVVASHRVIDVAAETPSVTTFVFASSYLIYDTAHYLLDAPSADSVPLSEDLRVNPRNLCGAGKYYTERELAYTQKVRRPDMRIVNARIYRSFGRGSRDVVSRWVEAGLAGERIQVFNRENRFDYIFADDVADALITLAQHPNASGIYNVGSGRGTAIDEVVRALVEAGVIDEGRIDDTGHAAPYEASVADISRIQREVGWSPRIDVKQAIVHIADHQERHRD